MDVAIAADAAYSVPLNACLATLAEHAPGCRLHLLDCGLGREDRRALRRTVGDRVAVDFVEVPMDALLRFPLPACGSHTTYARLLLEDLVPAQRVLYLDGDTLLRASVDELAGVELGEFPLAAVREMYTPTVSAHNGVKQWRELGLAPETPYFNAGVMVVDLPRWSSLNIGGEALAYLRRGDLSITLFDQEALNVAVAGRWMPLAPIWNTSRYWYKPQRRQGPNRFILEEAKILHFLSEDKPWLGSPGIPAAHRRAFFRAIDRSALAGWRPGAVEERPLPS